VASDLDRRLLYPPGREGDKIMIVQHPLAQVVPRTRMPTRTSMVWQIESSPRPMSDSALGQLLRALELLDRRGTGVQAWAAPFRDNPIAFLLDSIGDALRLWSSSGELLFQNRHAARLAERQGGHELHGAKVRHSREAPLERFTSRGQRFERRSLRCAGDGIEYVIEIVHPLTAGDGAPTRAVWGE
jgi:PAS domain-containing protein